MPGILNRSSAFSYHCHACGRCCHDKRIQTNPYELLRLSRNRGLPTGDFIPRYLETAGPYLRKRESGACIFLEDRHCGVHQDRPLACRTYPLGRWVSGEWIETFRELKAHPQSEGAYGRSGTVAQFLVEQGAMPFIDAADRYQALFYRMLEALRQAFSTDATLADDARAAIKADQKQNANCLVEWLDVDRAVDLYCKCKELSVSKDMDEIMTLHILSIDEWLKKIGGNEP